MKRLFPVIHILNETQSLRNAELCVRNQVSGVFLIHHCENYKELFRIAGAVRAKFPQLWIGTNALDLNCFKAFELTPPWIRGIWTDNCGVEQNGDTFNENIALKVIHKRNDWKARAEFFGGFAFKYQPQISNLEEGAALASRYCDVVTTSGDGTGIAADIVKIQRIFDGVARAARIGIASGITPENVKEYLPYVDDFLVATGISVDQYNFDEEKLKSLWTQIKS